MLVTIPFKLARYHCRIPQCKYSVSRKDRRRNHERKCKIYLLKLLKEHYDLSCDIKWLSFAHDFGRNINFIYDLKVHCIHIIFEDPWHLINFFPVPYGNIRGRIYGFLHKQETDGTCSLSHIDGLALELIISMAKRSNTSLKKNMAL